jgi:pseudouridine synthase, RluA family
MSGEMTLMVPEEDAGQRIDSYLTAEYPQLTRSTVQRLLQEGHITVNGKTAAKSYKLRTGDLLRLLLPPPSTLNVAAQEIPLEILFEDADLLVVNKPKGMVVHPAPGNPDGTLVNALLFHCGSSLSGIGGVMRPGIVHRIDKDTSGLLLVAKNDYAHQHLSAQIQAHSLKRQYQAVAHGNIREDTGSIDAPIARHPTDRKRMWVAQGGREARTHFEVLARYNGFTHLSLRLETGRTHQIRVHFAYRGHPIAGDPVYGPKKGIPSLQGQCLHAGGLGFVHPASGELLEFSSPPPEPFQRFLRSLHS